jgi:hypothetical protein
LVCHRFNKIIFPDKNQRPARQLTESICPLHGELLALGGKNVGGVIVGIFLKTPFRK